MRGSSILPISLSYIISRIPVPYVFFGASAGILISEKGSFFFLLAQSMVVQTVPEIGKRSYVKDLNYLVAMAWMEKKKFVKMFRVADLSMSFLPCNFCDGNQAHPTKIWSLINRVSGKGLGNSLALFFFSKAFLLRVLAFCISSKVFMVLKSQKNYTKPDTALKPSDFQPAQNICAF